MKKKLAIIYNLVCLILATMPAAQAYFDPGVGSMLITVLASAALAIGLCWKFIVAGIRKLFGKNKQVEDEEEDDLEDEAVAEEGTDETQDEIKNKTKKEPGTDN